MQDGAEMRGVCRCDGPGRVVRRASLAEVLGEKMENLHFDETVGFWFFG